MNVYEQLFSTVVRREFVFSTFASFSLNKISSNLKKQMMTQEHCSHVFPQEFHNMASLVWRDDADLIND